jgi:hypothetical protein
MKAKNRFTKICVLSVTFEKYEDRDEEPYEDFFLIVIRYLFNEFQPKVYEIILENWFPSFCMSYSTQSLDKFSEFIRRDHEEQIIDWAVEYVGCLYRFI